MSRALPFFPPIAIQFAAIQEQRIRNYISFNLKERESTGSAGYEKEARLIIPRIVLRSGLFSKISRASFAANRPCNVCNHALGAPDLRANPLIRGALSRVKGGVVVSYL